MRKDAWIKELAENAAGAEANRQTEWNKAPKRAVVDQVCWTSARANSIYQVN